MPTRTIVRWMSLLVAVIGWGSSAWIGFTHGEAAGINTLFIAALSVGICFTIVAGQWFLIPTRAELANDQAAYSLGYREGLSCGACPLRPETKEPSKLEIVRRV